MTFCFFKVPKKLVKEEFLQEILYIEDQNSLIKIQKEEKKEEEVERGVFVIDLF